MAYNESSIAVLEGLEAVRVRPGMYIGSTSVKGLNHLIYEIVDNSVDEYLAGACTNISVILESDGSCTVKDNGRGIPTGLHAKGMPAERLVFTTLHAGGKFDNNSYKTSGGLHGVGASVVNALSSYLDVRIARDGYIYHDHYEKGVPTVPLKKGLLPPVARTKTTGTRVNFLPDPDIFDTTHFKEDEIKNRLHQTAYLNSGLTLNFSDLRGNTSESITYHEPEGLVSFMKEINQDEEPLHDVISFDGEHDNIQASIAIQYTTTGKETIMSFCNNIFNVEGGTHVTGFKTALTSIINNYAREIGTLKEKNPNYLGADVRSGLTAIISIRHPDPIFEGQTKTKLDNKDATKVVSRIVEEELTQYFDRHLDTLQTIIKHVDDSAKLRNAAEKSRSNLLEKQKFSFDSNGKLANCESRDSSKCEIFIVEGDSAGGSAKLARNRKYQAIMPIRGKILNVEKATIDKVLANAEIKTMINAFGCGFSEGYGNDFNITKLRYDKIIIMADADVDGAHIATLLLTLFYRFMPELIYEGHVYVAMPPLYKVIPKKGAEKYLYDDFALADYRKRHKNFTLQRYKGLGEMDADQLWSTTMNPQTRLLKRIEINDGVEANKTTALLMGTYVLPRREFIHVHATDANLDF